MSAFRGPVWSALLQPFHDQSIQVESVVAVGCPPWLTFDKDIADGSWVAADEEAVLLRLGADQHGDTRIVERLPMRPSSAGYKGRATHTLESIRQSFEPIGDPAGEVLLLVPAHVLSEMIVRLVGNFSFRAVVILLPQNSSEARNVWKLQRSLFYLGLVGIGSVQIADREARCFLKSRCIRSVHTLGAGTRGRVAMSSLGKKRPFRQSNVSICLCEILCLAAWSDCSIFRSGGAISFLASRDPSCVGLNLPELGFGPFSEDDLVLWKVDEPPVDIDLWGYFQEIPECWQKHRSYSGVCSSCPLSTDSQSRIGAMT